MKVMAVDKNAVIKEAQKLASKGQFDKAIAEWRKLLKDFPSDSTIYNTIGDLCLKKGDAKGKTEAVEAYSRAGTILAAEGFTSKAIALYKKVLNIDPGKIEVHLALGDMNAEKGLAGPALESYKLVADHYTKQKKMAEALGVYQKMADLNPSNVAFRVKLAGMYAKEGMKDQAVKAYLDAADVHMSKDAFQDARQLFEKVLEIAPDNKSVYHKAGVLYAKEGKFDEARKALKRAFEADPENEEVMSLYLEVLDKAGRQGDAEDIYRKLLAKDATRTDLREKLYHVLLAKKDFDRALPEATALAESKAENADFAGAAEILRGFISLTHDPLAGAAVLADLFSKKGRVRDGALELLAAADALIGQNSPDDAREVLNRALLLVPDMPEVKSRLAEIGGAAMAVEPAAEAAPAAVITPPPPPPAARKAPEPAPPTLGEDPAITAALAEVEVLIKYGLAAKAIDQLEGMSRIHPDSLRVRTVLLDLYRKDKKPDKAVIQALMLAELYDNQGRSEESLSVLREALELAPGNPQIMARLGMPEPEAPEVIESVEEPEALETLPEEVPVGTLDLGAVQEVEAPELKEDTLELPEEVEEIAVPEEGQFAPLPEELEIKEVPPSLIRRQKPEPQPVPEETFVEEEAVFEQPEEKEPLAETELAELWAEAEFYYQQGLFDEARKQYESILEQNPGDPKAMERIVEIAREKEDVQEFSRLAEAVEGLESIVSAGGKTARETATASDVDAVRSLMNEISGLRKQQAEVAKERPAPPPAEAEEESFSGLMEEVPAAPPPAVARPAKEEEESFADLMEEISATPPPPPPKRPSRETEESFAGLMEEESFAGLAEVPGEERAAGVPLKRTTEDEMSDFFDLAAELKGELGTSAGAAAAPAGQEQSLDEIFEEFKAGVEAHEKKEDEDTHYNLGIAYREMGLLDDAISEFNMTTEGEPKFVQSRYMLGLCYLEKEDYETAIIEIQKALGYSYSLDQEREDRIGMHYDLGLAFQGSGNSEGALEEFHKVKSLDPNYREVTSKLNELKAGQFVSLDSIKEDIEKEISFKFLEESDRIEREEKTKKSKK